jgi:hypothetical protein
MQPMRDRSQLTWSYLARVRRAVRSLRRQQQTNNRMFCVASRWYDDLLLLQLILQRSRYGKRIIFQSILPLP